MEQVHNLATITVTVWDWDRRDTDDPMGAVKFKVRNMRGNMWKKPQAEGEEGDQLAAEAVEDPMAKRKKLLQARMRLQAARTLGDRAVTIDAEHPVLLTQQEEKENADAVYERDMNIYKGDKALKLPWNPKNKKDGHPFAMFKVAKKHYDAALKIAFKAGIDAEKARERKDAVEAADAEGDEALLRRLAPSRREDPGWDTPRCGNVFFAPFYTKSRTFAKTGSGQT
jgi:hypothetical protein